MTKEEAIRKHRKMWRWLAKNPGERKEDYLRKFDPEARLGTDCYLCGYVNENHKRNCRYCPVKWPEESCYCYGGLYSKWFDAMNYENYALAAEIAKQIAELPEKEKIK